jgi:DNA-binding protein Fis
MVDAIELQSIAAALASAGLSKVRMVDLQAAAVLNAMQHCDGNQLRAALLLDISTKTIQRKLKAIWAYENGAKS